MLYELSDLRQRPGRSWYESLPGLYGVLSSICMPGASSPVYTTVDLLKARRLPLLVVE